MARAFAFRNTDIVAALQRRAKILAAIRRHPASIGRADNNRAIEERSTMELIGTEIVRARRYGRPLSVMLVPIPSGVSRDVLRRVIRDTDQTAPGRDGVIVVLPETDRAGVRGCVERVAAMAGIPASSISAVNFPDDALTAGHLCELLGDGMVPRPIQRRTSGVEHAA